MSTVNFNCGHKGSKREAVFSVYHQTFQQVNDQSEKANILLLLPPTDQLVHKSTIYLCVDHAQPQPIHIIFPGMYILDLWWGKGRPQHVLECKGRLD
jgi:hypothetical protein